MTIKREGERRVREGVSDTTGNMGRRRIYPKVVNREGGNGEG